MAGKSSQLDWFRDCLVSVCRIHFGLIAVYAGYTIASDATHLISPVLVFRRWTAVGILLLVSGLVWYLARNKTKNLTYFHSLVYSLVVADILFAAFNIYTERGMASRAVMLFSLPILVSGLLLSRLAAYLTAILCSVAYVLAAVKYFVDFFNEGYKAELYIEVGFYCAVFFMLAAVVSSLVKYKGRAS